MIPWWRAAALVVLAAAGAGTGAWACRDGGSAREAPVAATERPDAGGGGAAAGRGPAATAASPPVERLRVRVVASYPHDPDAFTQGLLWHDGALYESTGRYGRSSLRLVDLATGVPQVQVPLPRDLFAEGLALAHGRLVQLTWLNGRALVWSLDGLTPVGEHRYRGEGWGLTFDGRSLVMSDGSAVLTFRDPQSFAVERRLKVRLEGRPLRALNELEW
ncbi:MAG TPA: glutaminyl-peptide cyclotransferase, partial [Thermoanaerobaculia bacterium]|nr:glutaminyl-peptide cyclotransferase [Thermoanaerobaculia bacterium]